MAFKIKVSKNYTLKLSINEAKLSDLCAGNSANIQQVLTYNLPSGPKSFCAFLETVPCWFSVPRRKTNSKLIYIAIPVQKECSEDKTWDKSVIYSASVSCSVS